MKMTEKTTYYKRNKKTILNRAKEYYENKNEELKKKARNKQQIIYGLFEKGKDIKREY